jgi:hypothetical protein
MKTACCCQRAMKTIKIIFKVTWPDTGSPHVFQTVATLPFPTNKPIGPPNHEMGYRVEATGPWSAHRFLEKRSIRLDASCQSTRALAYRHMERQFGHPPAFTAAIVRPGRSQPSQNSITGPHGFDFGVTDCCAKDSCSITTLVSTGPTATSRLAPTSLPARTPTPLHRLSNIVYWRYCGEGGSLLLRLRLTATHTFFFWQAD